MTGSGTHSSSSHSALGRFFSGESMGLAKTYWTLYIAGGVLFFVLGSYLVMERDWVLYSSLLFTTVLYSLVLLLGVKRYYRGDDPGKALARIAMLFLLLNLTNALLTFSFI